MSRVSKARTLALALPVVLGMGCSLIPLQVQTQTQTSGFGEPEPALIPPENRAAARVAEVEKEGDAEAARVEEIQKELASLRVEITEGKNLVDDATSFAEHVIELRRTKVARNGEIEVAKLEFEAAGYLERAIEKAPSLESFDLLTEVAPHADADAIVLRACHRVRPKVSADDVPSFTRACLHWAHDDPKKLKWASATSDVAQFRKLEAERIAAEAAAQEAERKAQAKTTRYVAAAVFAAGRCKFSNCLKDGWTASTPEGDIDVHCSFGDCMKDGWEARYPDGTTARTRCSFSNCMKDGWETSFPDGTTARTRCSFSDCLKNGWETDLPGGETARTRCSFSDCTKDGWTTDLPGGRSVACRCNFQKCFENGATCN
ncbi:hypothetical protein KEG38_08390 [Polyangium jinanense]|uniref:hypothetical protein n=1 Tax=Polyangium jinanense TaxID=2829994 RepID=UPI00233FCC19|nr:hypothetical protein [Polyangium jinanense]MDC3953860.1 hypothetical protein [Polyangium jinanense]